MQQSLNSEENKDDCIENHDLLRQLQEPTI